MMRTTCRSSSSLRERYRQRAELAATELGETAVRGEEGIELDISLLFGPLLYDGGHRAVVFAAEDMRFAVERETLIRARRNLRGIRAVRAFVDPRGLHLRWRNGAGGLNLRAELVRLERDSLLVVSLRARQPTLPVLLRQVLEELALLGTVADALCVADEQLSAATSTRAAKALS